MTTVDELKQVKQEQEAIHGTDGRDPITASGLLELPVGVDLGDVAIALRKLATLLNGHDPLDRRVVLNKAVQELKAKRITDARNLVDAAFSSVSATNGHDESQGTAITLDDPEPWLEPVDGGELVDEIYTQLLHYIAMPEHAAVAVTLWTLYTHVHDAFAVSPILAITSPEMQCGKTQLLLFVAQIVPRPLPASNVTPAALFRAVEKFAPTLLVDEADTFLRGRDELRGVLNSGHTRSGAIIIRTVGDDHEPRVFRTWAPKAIALIGNLPPTLRDRSITIPMRRRRPDEAIREFRQDRLDAFTPLRRKAARWAKDHVDALKVADPDDIPHELDDRARDNWRPLLAIADDLGWVWPAKAREAAKLMSGNAEKPTAAVQLLADLKELIEGEERMATMDILAKLHEMEDRPWPEWKNGRPMTARQLASQLRPFGISPDKWNEGGITIRGYKKDDFVDAWARYLPADAATAATAMNNNHLHDGGSATGADVVAVSDDLNPLRITEMAAMAARDRGDRE